MNTQVIQDQGFPEIRTIGDVLPFIQNKPEFRVVDKGDYTYIDYVVSKEDTFDTPQARECRGVKFNPDGTIASRPLHKFFNRNEAPELEKLYYNDNYRMYEKLDGSLIHFMKVGGYWRAMTKAGITYVSEQCEIEFVFPYNFFVALERWTEMGYTLCFEFTSPNNRIVIPYDKPELTLIAVRDTITGDYFPLDSFAESLGVPRVKEYTDISLSDVKEWVDKEGVVLVWDSGYRLKLKADDYVLKHKAKDQIYLEKNRIALILDDAIDDMADLLSEEEFADLKVEHEKVWDGIEQTAQAISRLVHEREGWDRKEIALDLKANHSRATQSLFWSVYTGKDADEVVIEYVRKHTTTQTKLDEVKWIWQ